MTGFTEAADIKKARIFMDKITKGNIGEIAALNLLRNKGYKIIEINWETKIGELDIVAVHGETLVFVEVKGSASLKYGNPSERVDFRKQRKLSMMAAQYIKTKRLFDAAARFDVIEVCGSWINHIENAFESQIRM